MVIQKVEKAQWIPVNNIAETERNEGGFGHTGKN
jgi:dUTPase